MISRCASGTSSIASMLLRTRFNDDLLNLHRIRLHLRRLRRWLEAHAYAVVPRVRLRERQHVVEKAVGVDQLAPDLAILDERPQAPDDLAGAQRLRADLLERVRDAPRRRLRRWRDQSLTGLSVRGDRRERLVHFVCDARGHFAHRRDAAEVRDAILHLARFVFRSSPIGDVVERAHLSQHASVGAARRLRDVVHVPQRAVGMDDAVFDVHGSRAGLELIAAPARQRPRSAGWTIGSRYS